MESFVPASSRRRRIVFDRQRFKTIIHYVCWICEDPRILGPVKLNRILWYADRNAYLLHGDPLAGVTFIKRPHGPLAKAVAPVLRELESEGVLATRSRSHSVETEQYFARRSPSLYGLGPEQLSVLEAVIRHICFDPTTRVFNKKAHDRVWRVARLGETIPHCTVFAGRPAEVTEEDLEWAAREARRPHFVPNWKEMDELRELNPRIEEACKGLVWFLSREPSAGVPVPNGGSSVFFYKQTGSKSFDVPDICVTYKVELEELVLGGFRFTFYGAVEDEEANGSEVRSTEEF